MRDKTKILTIILIILILLALIGLGFSIYWLKKVIIDENYDNTGRDIVNENIAVETMNMQSNEITAEFTEENEILTELTEEKEPESQIWNITISATGDCTLGRAQTHEYANSFDYFYDTYGEQYFFENVKPVFEQDSFTLVNLECVLSNSENRVEKEFNLRGKPEYVGIMTSGFVEGCSLANNHNQDYGYESFIDTENVLYEAGIQYAVNEHLGLYETEEGCKIGFVAASLLSPNVERENYIRDGIANLKEQGADIVIACCHWGIEKEHYPIEYQKNTAHKIIDWGADLVIGNHSHVLQSIEVYNGKVICYSLGNFCFGGNRNPSDKNTAIFQQTFVFKDGQLQDEIDARIIPCTVTSVMERNNFQPAISEGEKKQEIISLMNTYSEPLGTAAFDSEGKLVIER